MPPQRALRDGMFQVIARNRPSGEQEGRVGRRDGGRQRSRLCSTAYDMHLWKHRYGFHPESCSSCEQAMSPETGVKVQPARNAIRFRIPMEYPSDSVSIVTVESSTGDPCPLTSSSRAVRSNTSARKLSRYRTLPRRARAGDAVAGSEERYCLPRGIGARSSPGARQRVSDLCDGCCA